MNPAMHRRLSTVLLIGLCIAAPAGLLAAQDSIMPLVRSVPSVVRYGKWALLATAVGMGLKASSAHHDADQAFNRLENYCFADEARCDQQSNGHYIDPISEGYYQRSLSGDRRARGWLLGGEATLLATAGLFVWEFTRPKHPPKNIPFAPTVQVVGPRTQVGLRLSF